jgi:hypothetical protein
VILFGRFTFKRLFQQMPKYRIYLIDDEGQVSSIPAIADCRDDQAALAKAKQFAAGRPVEVWLLERRVARLNSGEPDVRT